MRKMQFRVLLLALLLCGIGIVLFLWLHPKQKPAANSLPISIGYPKNPTAKHSSQNNTTRFIPATLFAPVPF